MKTLADEWQEFLRDTGIEMTPQPAQLTAKQIFYAGALSVLTMISDEDANADIGDFFRRLRDELFQVTVEFDSAKTSQH